MIEQLFGSKTRVKLLHLFYSNPNRSFYVREITRKIDEQINSVRRELANLLNVGIIKSETHNNKLYYEVDQTYVYYKPFLEIFGDGPVTAEGAEAEAADDGSTLKQLGNLELVVYTGQLTRDETSGVDVLLVGDLNQTQVAKYIKELEEKESKELRYAVMTSEEFAYRQEVNDRFLSLVMDSKHQVVYDNKPETLAKDTEDKEETDNKEEKEKA